MEKAITIMITVALWALLGLCGGRDLNVVLITHFPENGDLNGAAMHFAYEDFTSMPNNFLNNHTIRYAFFKIQI